MYLILNTKYPKHTIKNNNLMLELMAPEAIFESLKNFVHYET